MKFLMVLSVLVFASFSGFAYNLKGRLQGKDGKSVAYANVNILSLKDSSTIGSAISDSMGNFEIHNLKTKIFLFQASCLGYKDYAAEITLLEGQTDLEPMMLESDGIGLNEVVVNGKKKVFTMKNGILTTNVSGTVLGKEHNITDVLRKIPGMSYDGKTLSVLGLGSPLIYIDGKKVTDNLELQRLLPENIATVQLITNPGSEYDASTHAVILIKTKKKAEGWMVQATGEGKYGRMFSENGGINLNYQKKKTNFFASYKYDNSRWRSIQDMTTTLKGDTLWNIKQHMDTSSPRDETHNVEAGMNYDLSSRTSMGMKYDGSFESAHTRLLERDTIYRDGKLYTPSKINSEIPEHTEYNHLNAFFITNISSKLDYYFYGDYVHRQNRRTQFTSEKPDSLDARNVYVDNASRSNLYGLDTYLKYKTGKKGQLKLGYNFTNTFIKGKLTEPAHIIPNSDYRNIEIKNAVYLSENYNLNEKFSFNAGLRYEYVSYSYKDKIENEDIEKKYSNLYPTLTMNYSAGSFSHSLSYTERTVRPSYSNMNANTVYSSRFCYQVGNPKLQPETDDRIQYNLTYKTYYLSFSYANKSNFIGNYMYTDPAASSRYIFTWKNFNRLQQWSATLYGEEKIGNYNPTLSVYFAKNIFRVDVDHAMANYDKPVCYMDFNNNVTFFKDWMLDIEYTYNGGGSENIFTAKPNYTFNFSIKKSFFNKTLDMNLYGNDIFMTGINRFTAAINNVSLYQRESGGWRQFGLSLIYRFNNYRKTYKGKDAAGDEIKRL